jgi:phosphoribosylglycinamide formyltransferase 2
LATPGGMIDLRIFSKPTARPYRRMAITLARAETIDAARRIAVEASRKIRIMYD